MSAPTDTDGPKPDGPKPDVKAKPLPGTGGEGRKIPIDELMQSAPALLGVSRAALAGALHGQTEPALTVKAAQQLVSDWSGRAVSGQGDDNEEASS